MEIKNEQVHSTTDLPNEKSDLTKKLIEKDKEINKLKNQITDLKEMIKLQKSQLLAQFELEKSKLILQDTNDHVFLKGKKYNILHVNESKWILDDVKKKYIDENQLAIVISKYGL